MKARRARWSVACTAAVGVALAYAQPAPPSAPRGELLYTTHCVGCHTTQVHWRARRLATDWSTLLSQVRRWQGNTGLGWSEQDIVDVTRYLNGQYYHFAPPARQAGLQPDATLMTSAGER